MPKFHSSRRKVFTAIITAVVASTCIGPNLSSSHGEDAASKDSYTIGLSMYSLRQLFADGTLDAFDYPAFARDKFGITEIDVWDGAFPADRKTDPEFYKELRAHADKSGSHIFLLMAGAIDIAGSETKQGQGTAAKGTAAKGKAAKGKQVAKEDFFAAVDHAVLLGAKYVRVFLKVPNEELDLAIDHTIQAITPIADYAKEKGVVIVIEPGASDWAKKGTFLAEVAKQMNHPACRLMPDFGKMKDDDPYGGTEAMMPYTDVVSAKSHNFDAEGNEVDFDYERLMKTIKDAGFRGVVAIEYEGKVLSPVEGVEATQKLLQRLR